MSTCASSVRGQRARYLLVTMRHLLTVCFSGVCIWFLACLVVSTAADTQLRDANTLVTPAGAASAVVTSPHGNLLKALFDVRLDLDGDGRVTQFELDAYYVASGTSHDAPEAVTAVLQAAQRDVAVRRLHAAEHVSPSDAVPAMPRHGGDIRALEDGGITWDEFSALFPRLSAATHPANPREVRCAWFTIRRCCRACCCCCFCTAVTLGVPRSGALGVDGRQHGDASHVGHHR